MCSAMIPPRLRGWKLVCIFLLPPLFMNSHMPFCCLIKVTMCTLVRLFICSICFWVHHRSGCYRLFLVFSPFFFGSVGSIPTASYVEIRIPAVRNQTCSERSAYSTTTAHERAIGIC